MSLIVQKFGGSSVSDEAKMLHVAHIIKRTCEAGNDVVVVLSAQGDTTDRLLDKARAFGAGVTPREQDVLLATGEQASVALCAMALESLGVPAVSLCAWQIPITTDASHGAAEITGVGKARVERELRARRVVLVAGFQGVDENGDVTTLGRGGSDTSAVALAAALGAERCRIYTDVDGVYTADPRICPSAQHLESVPYEHMLLLSQKGAQVLHDRSVALGKRHGVIIEVLSCEQGSRATRVCSGGEARAVTGVTRRLSEGSRLAAVTAVGAALPSIAAERESIAALEGAGVKVCGVEEGESQLTLFTEREQADRALCLVHDALVKT